MQKGHKAPPDLNVTPVDLKFGTLVRLKLAGTKTETLVANLPAFS